MNHRGDRFRVNASDGSFVVSSESAEGLQEYLAEHLLTNWAKRATSEPLDAYLARVTETTSYTVSEVEVLHGDVA
jgi:hypothetical protein